MRTLHWLLGALVLAAAFTPALADQQADIGGGAFGSVHKNVLYSVDTVSGKATRLATVPDVIGGIDTNASSDGVNSLALNTEDGVIYFTSNTTSDNNKAIFYYDMVNDQFGILIEDVTQLGVSFSGRGLGSAGAAFYDGRLYFGVETGSSSYQSKIYSLPVSADGKAVPAGATATLEYVSGEYSNFMQWGDFALGASDRGTHLYIGCSVYSGGTFKNKWQVWDLGILGSQGDETILVNNDKSFGQIGFDLNGNYYFVFGNTNKFAPINLETGDTGSSKDITLDGSTSPDDGSYDAAGIIPWHAEVRGVVWEDSNGDGFKDTHEGGIANVTVDLYEDLNNNGQYDSGERLLARDTTGADGSYRIYDLIPGNYVVVVSDQNGVLSGGSFTTPSSASVAVRVNQQKDSVNFGYQHRYTLEGRVYEEVNGDADLIDAQPRSDVVVYLYQDDGDGQPDTGDSLLQQTTTGSDGSYSFTGLADGAYWVVVDSKTVAPSNGFNSGAGRGDVWAEQTYGAGGDWGGALCDDDANSDTDAEPRNSNGACYGGRRGDTSDDASGLATAEHVAKVVVSGEVVTGVDFGFSFNVVTNTNDRDDDTGANRTAQGSLRQFIQNANAISGPNAMRFVPAVPTKASGGGGNWWSVALTMGAGSDDSYYYALPLITDSDTTIDGTAYSYQDGTTVRDTNPGTVEAPGPVGTNEVDLDGFDKPELEVNVNDWGIGLAIAAGVSNVKIQNLAMYNAGAANAGGSDQYTSLIWARGGSSQSTSGNEVKDSFLGPRADGSDPGFSTDAVNNQQARAGVSMDGYAQIDVTHNYVAHVWNTGVELQGEGVVQRNFIENIGSGAKCGDGVSVEQWSASYPRDRANVVIERNFIRWVAAYGVESWGAPGAYTVSENTMTETGRGDDSGEYCGDESGTGINLNERGGIRVFGSGSLIEKNVIHNVPGHGVVVVAIDSSTPSQRNTISQNSFYQNGGIAIDLDQTHTNGTGGSVNPNGDGVTPNDGATDSGQQNNGLDYPIFTLTELDGSNLRVVGYVGKESQPLSGTFTIEVYKADDDGNNDGEVEAGDGLSKPHGEGRWYLGSCTSQSDGTFDCTLPVPSDVSLAAGDAITGTATDSNGNTSEFGANATVTLPGVPVSGYVFYDLSANANRDAGEGWDPSYPQMYVKLIRGSGASAEVVQVVPINENTGAYRFEVVPPGEYTLIPDVNDDTDDTIPTSPSGWLFVSPAERRITVADTAVVDQDFALFHGGVVVGNVFWDTGDGDGEANDVVREGSERGIPNVLITATDGVHYRYTRTDEDGFFRMYIPYEWGDRHVILSHSLRPATGYSTCLCGGEEHPVRDWDDAMAVDSSGARADLGPAEDITQSIRAFGVARPSEFRPDQEGSTTTPGTRVYRHTYRPGTQGEVVFRRRSGDYVYQMRLDRNCDGDIEDDGETTWVPVTDAEGPSWVVDDAWPRNPDGSFKSCAVEVRVLVPDGEPEGAVDLAELVATLTWANNAAVADRRAVVDTTRVRILGTLRLEKLGRRVADPDADRQPGDFPDDYAASVSGAPGDVLEYCIAYTNVGSDAVTDVAISDPVPFFADALPDAFGAGKAIYWKDADGNAHWLTANGGDDAGAIAAGILEVQAETTLGPGQGGLVCYRVRIR